MLRHGKTIGTCRDDESVFRFDHHLAVAVDQTGLAVDVDLREPKLVVVDDAILRLDDFASVSVDEAVETTDADRGPVVRKFADPIVLRGYRDRAVATDCAAQTTGKRAHRCRKGHRFGRPGTVVERMAVERDYALQDDFARGRQL